MLDRKPNTWITLLGLSGLAAVLVLAGCDEKKTSNDTGTETDGDAVTDTAGDVALESGEIAAPPIPTEAQATPLFTFEKGTDDLSKMLTEAYETFTTAPQNETEFKALFASRKKTSEYFKAHAEDAAQKLIDELDGLDQREERPYRIIMHLLGDFESAKGIQFLFDQGASELPQNPTPLDSDADPRVVKARLRILAVTELGRVAVAGSESAKGKILDLVGQGKGLDVKGAAVKAFYAANPSRSKAKLIMKTKLKPEERYLLFEVY